MKRFDRLASWIKALVITAGAFALSWFVAYDLSSISFFAPMEKVSDYRFSDFYMAVADEGVHRVDDDVVVVALDGCNRRQIAEAISDADACGARAIGLDIMFGPPREGLDDSALREVLATTRQLVLPVYADDETGEMIHVSYYDSLLIATSRPRFAAINLEGEARSRATIRRMRTSFGPVPSMAAALAGDVSADRMCDIAFARLDFHILSPDEIIDNRDLIDGKIVLMGKLDEVADLHATPLSNFMPGTLIHAYCVSTIVNDSAPVTVPDYIKWLTAFACCYLIVWLNIVLGSKGYGNLAVRVVQLLMLYVMILVGTRIYAGCNVDLDFGFPVLMVSLGLLAHDIVSGVLGFRLPDVKIFKSLKKLFKSKQ